MTCEIWVVTVLTVKKFRLGLQLISYCRFGLTYSLRVCGRKTVRSPER